MSNEYISVNTTFSSTKDGYKCEFNSKTSEGLEIVTERQGKTAEEVVNCVLDDCIEQVRDFYQSNKKSKPSSKKDEPLTKTSEAYYIGVIDKLRDSNQKLEEENCLLKKNARYGISETPRSYRRRREDLENLYNLYKYFSF